MKTFSRNIALITLVILSSAISEAQRATYTTNDGMTIGFGIGGAYQKSDIVNSTGVGFDFWLGHNFASQENAFLAADWRFRFLAGENRAHDHRINGDGTFTNARFSFFSYDLEFGLTLNRLRERTRIVLSGFAGGGITHGRTFTDLYDASNTLYDYSSIDISQSRSQINAALLELSDGDYETRVANKAAVMPTLGFFIGYRFSRSFTLGIEHKVNIALAEQVGLFGMNMDNSVNQGSPFDRNNYTTLGFKWNLGGGGGGRASRIRYTGTTPVNTTTTRQTVTPTRPVNDPVPSIPVPPPTTVIVNPQANPYSTTSGNIEITARVTNVRSRQGVRVTHNGNNLSFEYNPGTGIVQSAIILREGTNNLVVSATNEAGNSVANVIITFRKPVSVNLPVVRFVNPANPVTVETNVFPIRVQTTHVASWNDVTVSVNSIETTNFTLNQEGLVTTNIGLKEGQNTIVVSGRNSAGVSTERTNITFTRPVKVSPPAITITMPSTNPFTTYNNSQQVSAVVSGVTSKANITVTINGTTISGFSFDSGTSTITIPVSLEEGITIVSITARNEVGQDVKSQNIKKEIKPCPLPSVEFISPSGTGQSTDNMVFTLKANLANVPEKNQISLVVNGNTISDYNFTGTQLSYTLNLVPGNNRFTLSAKTECGSASVSSGITYTPAVIIDEEKPCPKPSVNFGVVANPASDATHHLTGSVAYIKNTSDITFTINGVPQGAIQFVPNTGELSAKLRLVPGTHIILVTAKNECGTDTKTLTVTVEQPCVAPKVSFTVSSVTGQSTTHELRGTISNLLSRNEITMKVNGRTDNSFVFNTGTGAISAGLILQAGTHNISLSASNACGQDTRQDTIKVEEKQCGPRINPGNASWEFCLVTPTGTITRDSLTNKNFSYSGPASSLFFMPIAGGGDVVVAGKPYTIRSGRYYLFTGNLRVTVSTKNPGSMGQWSVCIEADAPPTSGIGNNRPKSPCEGSQETRNPDDKGKSQQKKQDSPASLPE